MSTPIFLLVLMSGPYLVLRVLGWWAHREFDLRWAGAFGLTLLFVVTGVAHFTDTDAMAQMLPVWLPGRVPMVYLTGVAEFAIASGFLFRPSRRATGLVAAAMLVLFFPANVYAAMHQVPMGGHALGPIYLLVRAPLQLIILAWVYWFAIRETGRGH